MAKKSQRRLDRNAKPGCMWGLINLLDFRHGRTTQKLLPDRRRETKRVIGGSGHKNIKLDDQKALDGDGNLAMASDFGKPSVKKLIEEDLLKEHKAKSEISDSEVKANSGEDLQKKKNSKRTKRSRSKSCEIHVEDLNAVDIREAGQPYPQYLEKQSSITVDVGELIEEFCLQLQQKGSSSCIMHGESCEFHQSKQNNLDFEERWSNAIKVFVSQKVNERRKLLNDERNVCSSKELKDALHNLFSDEGFSSKLSQGQKCIIMKQLEKAWNSQVEIDEDSTLAVRRNTEDQDLCELNKSHEPAGTKHRRFFRRAKSRANNPSREADSLKASNRIVILKPTPTAETKSSLESCRKSQLTTKDKGSNERGNFHFSLTEIKRRLKNAMGKETPQVSTGHTSKRYSNEVRVSGNGDRRFKENTGKSSSGKEHFFLEKIARPKAAHVTVKPKGSEQSIEVEPSDCINPRLSNIYIEAKKHLSEMLITGTDDVDLPSGQVPKPLGRILSFPEYNFSPVSSPSRDLRPSFVTAQMRLPSMDSVTRRASNISHMGRTPPSSEVPSLISEDSTDIKAQVLSDPTSCSSSELVHDGDGEKSVGSTRDEIMTRGQDVEIENSLEIIAPEERIIDSNLAQTSSCCVIINDRNADSSDAGDEKEKNELLKHESSLFESPSASSNVKHRLEPSEIVHRPSPVSVLEPLFLEEDISPAASRTQHVELLVQPLRIDFEEQDSSSRDWGTTSPSEARDENPMLEYIKAVLLSSGLNWEEFYLMSDSSEQILDPSSCNEFEFLPNHLCCDKQLLFNCIDEVLMEVYDSYFGCSPGLSVGKPVIRPIPDMKHTVDEVWRRLHWHLLPFPSPRTLDQVARKDMMKNGVWMDIRRDTETVLVDISNVVFQELIEEIVFCLSESR